MMITPHPPTPKLRTLIFIGILLLFIHSLTLPETTETHVYEAPPDLDDGSKVASVETVGLNTHAIEDLTEHLLKAQCIE
jgi:hypothetical protein